MGQHSAHQINRLKKNLFNKSKQDKKNLDTTGMDIKT